MIFLPVLNLLLLLVDAVRILIYMRFCRTYIGVYRVHKKFAASVFVLLWLIDGFIRLSAPAKHTSEITPVFYVVETMLLFVFSFFCQGRFRRRIAAALLLPMLYWGVKWLFTVAVFQTLAVTELQYFISTGAATFLLLLWELFLERTKKSKQEQEYRILEQKIRMYENQFEIIHQSQKHIRSLQHDLKHHVKMLSDMAANGENADALDYLSEMGSFMEYSKEYVASGNEKIDSILNYMIEKAKASGIDADWKIQIPEHLNISAFDINVILSNLFENAFHALREMAEPALYILMKYDRGILCISVQNNCSPKKIKEDKKISIVEPAGEHGHGLDNVKRIAEKYYGSVETSCLHGVFTASVLLFMSDTV